MRACSGVLLGLLLGSTVACSGTVSHDDLQQAGSVITGLTVSGEVGSIPGVRMRTPLEVTDTTSAITVTGTGAPIQVDQLFLLELTLYDARTGRLALSTYQTGTAVAAKTTDDKLFPKLSEALVGVRQGSRLALAATAADAFAAGGTPPKGIDRNDPVVVVADVVAVPPTKVLDRAETPATVDFDQVGARPARPEKIVLIEGTGPPVGKHSLITVDYLAQHWRAADPFESTYFKEPEVVAIGAGTAPAGWDEQLVGVRRGSRVMLVVPNENGVAGHGTIVWVVDVLGVS